MKISALSFGSGVDVAGYQFKLALTRELIRKPIKAMQFAFHFGKRVKIG